MASVYVGIAAAARNIAVEAVKVGTGCLWLIQDYPGTQYAVAEICIRIRATTFIRQTAQRLAGEPERRDAQSLALAISTKVFATDERQKVVNTAMQTVGGRAKQSPLERMYRDVRQGKIHPYETITTLWRSSGRRGWG
ncbi:MAG: hypothetical protein H6676_05585 [Thermoflexaceae bacterium]|nr:hypothetical protein [Thermoflexaceae bacterium]